MAHLLLFSVYTQEEVNVVLIPFMNLAQTKLRCPLFVREQQVVVVPATSMICDVSSVHCCRIGCKVQVNTRVHTDG